MCVSICRRNVVAADNLPTLRTQCITLKLTEVVPWGRTLEEYRLMFDLSEADLKGQILGCGDGPASFNAEMTALGHSVVSVDPLYQFSGAEIRQRVQDTYETVISQVRQNSQHYVWKTFADAEALGKARLDAMEQFLLDYETGKAEGRYRAQSLPKLDLSEKPFDLSLCSHFLFLYAPLLSADFHVASVVEMLRVSAEVRIFPLLTLGGEPSPFLDTVIEELSLRGFEVQVEPVAYEFQKGGNQMLRVGNER